MILQYVGRICHFGVDANGRAVLPDQACVELVAVCRLQEHEEGPLGLRKLQSQSEICHLCL